MFLGISQCIGTKLRGNSVYSVLIPYVDFGTCSVTPKAEHYLEVDTDHWFSQAVLAKFNYTSIIFKPLVNTQGPLLTWINLFHLHSYLVYNRYPYSPQIRERGNLVVYTSVQLN